MDIIFMNSENTKTSHPYIALLTCTIHGKI